MDEAQRPTCRVCGVHPCERNSRRSGWLTRCQTCRKSPHAAFKKDACEQCGFTGHRCQFDVDHIDGDRDNNDPENLRTLCANCHRLSSYEQRHYLRREHRGLE